MKYFQLLLIPHRHSHQVDRKKVEILQYINNFIFSIIFSEATGSVFETSVQSQQNDLSGEHSWRTKRFVGEWKKICTKAVASVLLGFNEKADGCELEREED